MALPSADAPDVLMATWEKRGLAMHNNSITTKHCLFIISRIWVYGLLIDNRGHIQKSTI
jgi:hypothetical protein